MFFLFAGFFSLFRSERPADLDDQKYDIENKCTCQKSQSRIFPTGKLLEDGYSFQKKSIQGIMIYRGRGAVRRLFCFCGYRLAVCSLLALPLLQFIGLGCCQDLLGGFLAGTAQKGISIVEVQVQYIIFYFRLAGNILGGVTGTSAEEFSTAASSSPCSFR